MYRYRMKHMTWRLSNKIFFEKLYNLVEVFMCPPLVNTTILNVFNFTTELSGRKELGADLEEVWWQSIPLWLCCMWALSAGLGWIPYFCISSAGEFSEGGRKEEGWTTAAFTPWAPESHTSWGSSQTPSWSAAELNVHYSLRSLEGTFSDQALCSELLAHTQHSQNGGLHPHAPPGSITGKYCYIHVLVELFA